MATLSAAQIYQYARQAGFPPVEAALMTAIALRESAGVTTAYNGVGRDNSVGLWQINMLAHGDRFGSRADLESPETNARAAFTLWQQAGFSPWQMVDRSGPFGNTNFAAAAAGTGGEVTVAQMNGTAGEITGGSYSQPEGSPAEGGQYSSMTEDPSNYTDEELIAYVQEHYGSMSWALGNPELRDIMFSGIREGWSQSRIQSAVQNSDYYRTTSDNQRSWGVLYATNPGEAGQQLQTQIGDLSRMARTLGVSITRERLQMVAWNAVSMGWDGEQMQRALLAEANWNGRHIGEFGTIGATVTQVNQLAEAYGLTLDRDRALGMTRDILSGGATMESITAGFKTQAKALFPAFADELDAGMRLADIAQPYMQTASQLLELNPAEMRLTDPLWSAPLTRRQNGRPSPMSVDEWTTHVMNDQRYGWDRTDNAMSAAASFVDNLGSMFGVF